MRHLNHGFTLVELLIAVAIIGILGAIAYPSYQGYISDSRRVAAQQFMLDIANAQESYRTDALTYADDIAADLRLTEPSDIDAYYDFSLSGVTATTFTITGTAKGSQPGPNLTLDQSGAKSW